MLKEKYIEIINNDILGHCLRVSVLVDRFANVVELNKGAVVKAALYHDIGKFMMLDIIKKPGPLSKEDREIIKMHPSFSVMVLGEEIDSVVMNLILTHHSTPDSKGYPKLSDKLSIEQEVLQIADLYDALTTNRIYRKKPVSNWEKIMLEKGYSSWLLDEFEEIVRSNEHYEDIEMPEILTTDILKIFI